MLINKIHDINLVRIGLYLTGTYIGFMQIIKLYNAVNYIDYYIRNSRMKKIHTLGLICGLQSSSILIGGSFILLIIPYNVIYYKIVYGSATFLYFSSYMLLPKKVNFY